MGDILGGGFCIIVFKYNMIKGEIKYKEISMIMYVDFNRLEVKNLKRLVLSFLWCKKLLDSFYSIF